MQTLPGYLSNLRLSPYNNYETCGPFKQISKLTHCTNELSCSLLVINLDCTTKLTSVRGPSHMTPEPILVLRSDPAADQILLSNIWSYPHHSKSTPLPPSTLSLFRLWLPNAGTQGHCSIYNVDYSLQEPHLIL